MLRVVSVWTGKGGSPWVSTLFFAGSISTEAQAAVNRVDDLMTAIALDQVTGTQVAVEPFVASVNPVNGDTVGGFVTEPLAQRNAQASGDMLPAAAQVMVSLRTGAYIGGRELRGKFYMPGLYASLSDPQGNVDEAARPSLQAKFDEAFDGGPQLLVWSRKSGTAEPVSAFTVSPKFAVLRSRRD